MFCWNDPKNLIFLFYQKNQTLKEKFWRPDLWIFLLLRLYSFLESHRKLVERGKDSITRKKERKTLTKDLDMRNISVKMVPWALDDEQKQLRLDISTDFSSHLDAFDNYWRRSQTKTMFVSFDHRDIVYFGFIKQGQTMLLTCADEFLSKNGLLYHDNIAIHDALNFHCFLTRNKSKVGHPPYSAPCDSWFFSSVQ